MTAVPSPLSWDVYVTAEEPVVTDDLAPGAAARRWPPISATLISAGRDAVLVDPLMTVGQARGLGDWIASSGKNLTAVFVTHGHGDHWFGLSVILDRFPGARAFAVPGVVEQMRRSSTPEYLAAVWYPRLPGKIPSRIVLADPLPGHVIDLEGHQLVAVELGHTDMDQTSCLHVPDIGLVVAGDAAYNDVHLHLSESDHQDRLDWLAALRTIESLNPKAVVAGHKRATRADDPQILGETSQYIRDVDRVAETATTARELYDEVLELHPGRLNPGALWTTAHTIKP
jgi:glyoxylase-like metal-dependent hydrolase (beta-lactamase superfamily II)